jgi:photosystem II stability/assembly factor-like uncharacterized protein
MKKLLLSLSFIAFSSAINAQWTSQATNFDTEVRGLSQIKIVDANIVWALAYDGSGLGANVQEFTRTIDGGASWNAGLIDLGNPDLEINNICPVSATTAWVSALIPAEGKGVIFKTTDGGASWNQQLTEGFQAAASFLNGVYFFNENVGIAYGDPVAGNRFEIYRTIDGGDTWTSLPTTSSTAILSGEYGYNNDPITAGGAFWFTTSKGRLYRSIDQGATFTAAAAPLNDFGGVATPGTTGTAIFSDANTGYLLKAVGTTYTYSTTSNGGASWTPTTPVPFTGTRRLLTYIPGTTRIVATSAAAPVGTSVSTDNGTSWTDVESDAQRGVSAFLNDTTGWCAGFSGALVDGIFKLTSPLGTNDVTASAKFKVYPNPATSTITISAADVDSYQLNVTDLTGKTVMTKPLNGMENNVDISALSSGAYFFELSSDNKREVVKILKN